MVSVAPAAPRTMIVIVPGLKSKPEAWQPLLKRLRQEPELANSMEPVFLEHNIHLFSPAKLRNVAARLRARLEEEYLLAGEVDRILLFGHSLGGALVREIYLQGVDSDWAKKVSRIVLFAGMSRGYVMGRNFWVDVGYRLGWVLKVLMLGRTLA